MIKFVRLVGLVGPPKVYYIAGNIFMGAYFAKMSPEAPEENSQLLFLRQRPVYCGTSLDVKKLSSF